MKRIFFLGLILFSLPCLLVAAELKKEYPCYHITQEPILDGKIEEGVWKTVPEATGFFILGAGEDGYAVEKQTSFKAGWTKDTLYLAVRCEEPTPEKMLAKLEDGGSFWFEDSIELFFFPEKATTFFQLAINGIGSRWNGTGSGGGQSIWNWQVKTYVGKDFWSLEAKIPFTVLGRTPKEGEKWLVNVGRNNCTGPAAEFHTCWPPLKTGFYETGGFGLFIFKETPLLSQEKEKVEYTVNLPYYLFLRSEIDKMAKDYSKFKEAISDGLRNQSFQKEAISLKESWGLVEKIAAQKRPALGELRSFFSQNYNLVEKSENFKSLILTEKLFE